MDLYCRYQRLAVREEGAHDHELWEQHFQYFAATNEHATFVPFCLRPARRAGLTFMNGEKNHTHTDTSPVRVKAIMVREGHGKLVGPHSSVPSGGGDIPELPDL